jgi:class 3 adenylate cyclase/TolB-like protein
VQLHQRSFRLYGKHLLYFPWGSKKSDNLTSMSQAVVRELDDSKRYPCAIMFTDILGFTRLMRKDEERTIKKMESHRRQLEVLHEHFDGRIIQYYGDGSLSVFDDCEQALKCAIAIQKSVKRLGLPLKIGIHLGHIVEKGSAIYGDGVNVASRIESVGVADCILFSGSFWKAIKDKDFQAQSLGSLHFKHLNKPIRVYGLVAEGLVIPDRNQLEGKLAERAGKRYKNLLVGTIIAFLVALGLLWNHNLKLNALLDDDITTVGVMPFRMAGLDLVDQSFQAGLFENLVTNLSSFYGLQVLSSRATEPYANSKEKPTTIGQELGVSHLLYGTCRPGMGDSIRINLELVDVRNGRNVWAKSVSRIPGDFYAAPIDISEDLATFLEARENPFKDVEQSAGSKLSASYYNYITQARVEGNKGSAAGFVKSNELLRQAIAQDSSVGLGYALLSQNYSLMHQYGYIEKTEALDHAEQYGGIALYYDRNLAEAYVSNALMQYVFFQAESQEIMELLQQAVMLRPSYDYAYYLMGKVHFDLQDYESAENYFSLALKLSPDKSLYLDMLARTALANGLKLETQDLAKELEEEFPGNKVVEIQLAYLYADLADKKHLKSALDKLRDGEDKMRVSLYCELVAGDLFKAKQTIDEFQRKYPASDLGDLLVRYYDKTNNTTEVWKVLDQALLKGSTWLKEIKHLDLSTAATDPERFAELLENIQLTPLDW